jgi:hypothetical protein
MGPDTWSSPPVRTHWSRRRDRQGPGDGLPTWTGAALTGWSTSKTVRIDSSTSSTQWTGGGNPGGQEFQYGRGDFGRRANRPDARLRAPSGERRRDMVDALPERTGESRAGGIHSRTLEVLDQRGVLDRFLAAGDLTRWATSPYCGWTSTDSSPATHIGTVPGTIRSRGKPANKSRWRSIEALTEK